MKKILLMILLSQTLWTLEIYSQQEPPSLYSELIPFYDVNSQYIKEALEKALNIDPKGTETIVLLNNASRDNPQGAGSDGGGQSVVVGAPVVDEGARGDFKRVGGEVLVNLSTPERVEFAKKIIRTIDYPRDIVDIEFVLVSIDRQLLNESGITLEAMFENFRASPQEIAKSIAASDAPSGALENADLSSATLGIGTLQTAVQYTFHKLRVKLGGGLTSRELHGLATVIKTINLPVREGLKSDYTLETKDIIVTQSAFGTGSVSVSGGITLSVRPMIDRTRTEKPEIVIDFLYSNGSVNTNSSSQEQMPRVTRLEHKQSLSVVPGEVTPLSSLVSTSNEKSNAGFDFLTFIPIGQKTLDTESRLDLLLLLRANIRKEGQISLFQILLDNPQLREELLGQGIISETYLAKLNSNLTLSDILHRLQLTSLNSKNREKYQAPLLLEITEMNEVLKNHVLEVTLRSPSVLCSIVTLGINTKPSCWEEKTTVKELATTGLPIPFELEDDEDYYLFVRDASHNAPIEDEALIKFTWHQRAHILEQLNEPTYGRIKNEN